MMRDPRQNPRPGDVVQVYSALRGSQTPAPLTITAVDSRHVHWQRGDFTRKTPLSHWKEERLMGGGYLPKMDLLE